VDNGPSPALQRAPGHHAKIAYDTQVSGKALHFELAGFSSQFAYHPAGKYF